MICIAEQGKTNNMVLNNKQLIVLPMTLLTIITLFTSCTSQKSNLKEIDQMAYEDKDIKAFLLTDSIYQTQIIGRLVLHKFTDVSRKVGSKFTIEAHQAVERYVIIDFQTAIQPYGEIAQTIVEASE